MPLMLQGHPLPCGEGQIVCDPLEEQGAHPQRCFLSKGHTPARLTEMHCDKFWGEFFLYHGCLVELKEVFA